MLLQGHWSMHKSISNLCQKTALIQNAVSYISETSELSGHLYYIGIFTVNYFYYRLLSCQSNIECQERLNIASFLCAIVSFLVPGHKFESGMGKPDCS